MRPAAPATTSQPAAPARGSPSSAATVTGVLCDARLLRLLPAQARAVGVRPLEAADARRRRAGWSSAIFAPSVISPKRPLVARFRPFSEASKIEWRTLGAAIPADEQHDAGQSDSRRRPPAPDEGRGGQRPGHQRGEARLREREEQADPDDGDQHGGAPARRARARAASTSTRLARIAITRKRP